MSFNHPNYIPQGQHYAICIRQEEGHCSIAYSTNPIGSNEDFRYTYRIRDKVKTYSKWNWKSFCCFRTSSGHFFANYMNIFHKTEVQTVILRCLTGLKLNWLKSYDTKCKHFHFHFFAILSKKNSIVFFAFWVFLHFVS